MAKQIEDMTLPELLDQVRGAPQPGAPLEGRISTMIQVRLAEQQEKAALALVAATYQLGKTTFRLVCATWGLVGATLVLVMAEVILKLAGFK
jgi:hypothetical protein